MCARPFFEPASPRRGRRAILADARGAPTRAAAAIVEAIRNVLEEAIEAGGSTLRDHRQANGELGYFQHVFKVYDREGLPCVSDALSRDRRENSRTRGARLSTARSAKR